MSEICFFHKFFLKPSEYGVRYNQYSFSLQAISRAKKSKFFDEENND